eukprot:CAMPEP_0172725918 /NCGR_PEP_ID=MMETSP1074-20121228/89547_1 /TAXON_ID=2916 /ORGANISM="Ceratium fusus, Strain PA161109" /LENGTH=199 /DNA_ID=CAMNT_0013552801 /DNA_START=38 /DNA_END=641 /DNA_ORIENTATION=-
MPSMLALLVASGAPVWAASSSQLHVHQSDVANPKSPEVSLLGLPRAAEAHSLGAKTESGDAAEAVQTHSFRSGTYDAMAIRTQGGAEVVIPLLLVAVLLGGTIWLLWHNNWDVHAAVDEGKIYAGRAAASTKRAVHGTAKSVERMTAPEGSAQSGEAAHLRAPDGAYATMSLQVGGAPQHHPQAQQAQDGAPVKAMSVT